MQQMRSVVGDFQHLAIDSGIEAWNPTLAQSLQEAISNVNSLAESDESSSNATPTTAKQASKRVKTGRKRSHSPDHVAEAADAEFFVHQQDWLPESLNPKMDGPPLGYEFNLDDREQNPSAEASLPNNTQDWLNAIPQASVLPIPETATFTQSWMVPINKELTPIRSYNYAEKSFARRWHRFCYEDTYNLLTDPGTPPRHIHHILRYSLCFGSIRMIAQRIKYKLMRPANEPLEMWELPVLHVGGSGHHFRRDGVDNSKAPPQGFARDRNFGPWQRPTGTTPADVYPYQVAEWLGIEGVWFDGYDVEQYLRTKGLYLDGSAAIAKLEIDDAGQPVAANPGLGSPSDGTTLSYSTPDSPTSPAEANVEFLNTPSVNQVLSEMTATEVYSLDPAMDVDFPVYTTMSDKMDLNMFPPLDDVSAVDAAISTELVPAAGPAVKKREVAIDVEKLIRGMFCFSFKLSTLTCYPALHSKAICLGRSPGIKREDVDVALQEVIQEAWDIY